MIRGRGRPKVNRENPAVSSWVNLEELEMIRYYLIDRRGIDSIVIKGSADSVVQFFADKKVSQYLVIKAGGIGDRVYTGNIDILSLERF